MAAEVYMNTWPQQQGNKLTFRLLRLPTLVDEDVREVALGDVEARAHVPGRAGHDDDLERAELLLRRCHIHALLTHRECVERGWNAHGVVVRRVEAEEPRGAERDEDRKSVV